jgi:Ca2+-binding RTX toxin-like protein
VLSRQPAHGGWLLRSPTPYLLAAILAVMVLLIAPARSSPEGWIVLYGAETGSRLELSTNGSDIVADGYMSARPPVGCRLDRNRLHAVCPIGEAEGFEVVMGPSGDFVRVLAPMPLPLVIHLGAGEDKFIGNSEEDTCYGEATRRNRCVGGPGNDVCITGPKASDCVGGPGDDYCKHSTGSDGCWGGPGNDICLMGPGEDGCHGEGGDDRLFGGPGTDQLYGGSGSDYCDGGPGIGRSQQCESGPGH